MLVTLMTDASHCLKTLAAGFGFWCASNRGKLAGGKPISTKTTDSYSAEAKGVANSLYLCINAETIKHGDTILIQLDNKSVVDVLNGGSTKRTDVRKVINYIRSLARKYDLTLITRHVKGHTRKIESRYAANRHCDTIAGQQMRIARSLIK